MFALTALFASYLLGSVESRIPPLNPDGKVGRLPAMGWNSWNEYECDISEETFLKVAELLVSTGLKDLGYEYVNIDDCWSDKEKRRDPESGEIIPDRKKFPKGIKHTADAVHELGLKFGIYSDAGILTCANYEGSLEHEAIDAHTFASWGVDYLKYDNCNVPKVWADDYDWNPERWRGGSPEPASLPDAPANYNWTSSLTAQRYRRMQDALDAQNRTILYSLCDWGHARVDLWGPKTGQSYRMWADIVPEWSGPTGSIMTILNHASFFGNVSDHYSFGDWDMLEVGNGKLTLEENRSHFALWAALKSPLIIGTPLVTVKKEILEILGNKNLIAFNQDEEIGTPALPYKWGINEDNTWNQTHPAEFWSGKSSKGVHVFVLNTQDKKVEKEVVFEEVPELKAGSLAGSEKFRVWDMWTDKDLGVFDKKFVKKVKAHDTLALRIESA